MYNIGKRLQFDGKFFRRVLLKSKEVCWLYSITIISFIPNIAESIILAPLSKSWFCHISLNYLTISCCKLSVCSTMLFCSYWVPFFFYTCNEYSHLLLQRSHYDNRMNRDTTITKTIIECMSFSLFILSWFYHQITLFVTCLKNYYILNCNLMWEIYLYLYKYLMLLCVIIIMLWLLRCGV